MRERVQRIYASTCGTAIREGIERMAGGPPTRRRHEIDTLFRRLEELERLWAYPGAEPIDRPRGPYQSGGPARSCAAAVNELVDQLSELGDRAALTRRGRPAGEAGPTTSPCCSSARSPPSS